MALRTTNKYWPHRGNVLVTDAPDEPIGLVEIKKHLSLSHDNDDRYLGTLLIVARRYLEDFTNLAFYRQSWKLALDHWPGYHEPWWDGVREGPVNSLFANSASIDIILPRYPLIDITSITVYDEESNSTAVTVSTVFDVDTVRRPGRITLKRGQTWPIATRASNAIEIVYRAGYGTDNTTLPPAIRQALLQTIAYLYTHRGDGCSPEQAAKLSGALNVLAPYVAKQV